MSQISTLGRVPSLPHKETHRSPRLNKLYRMEEKIRQVRFVYQQRNDYLNVSELDFEWYKTAKQIQNIVDDPLENDYCVDNPDADECRVHDN